MLTVAGREMVDDEVDGRSLLDEIAREGARRMLLAALETEVAAYLEAHAAERDGDGHALVVRNGKGRTRNVTVGSGTIAVSAPRVNDRRVDAHGQRCKFTSRILPPYMRRSPKVAEGRKLREYRERCPPPGTGGKYVTFSARMNSDADSFHGAIALGIMQHARAPSCCVHCRPSGSLADRTTRMRRR